MTPKKSSKFLSSFNDPASPLCRAVGFARGKGEARAGNVSHEKVLCERNKRLITWMADVLNLERNDRRSFFEDRMRHFEGASDDEIAQNVLDQLPPMAFMESFADAKELVMHFQAIAEGWLFEICDRN